MAIINSFGDYCNWNLLVASNKKHCQWETSAIIFFYFSLIWLLIHILDIEDTKRGRLLDIYSAKGPIWSNKPAMSRIEIICHPFAWNMGLSGNDTGLRWGKQTESEFTKEDCDYFIFFIYVLLVRIRTPSLRCCMCYVLDTDSTSCLLYRMTSAFKIIQFEQRGF